MATTAEGVLPVLLLVCLSRAAAAHAGSRFTSHVSVRTPAHSFTHGVGDLVGSPRRHPRVELREDLINARALPYVGHGSPHGYPRERPAFPFYQEDIVPGNSLLHPPWHAADFLKFGTIPVLPASPYRVNSPNPESLWPEGLFVPPSVPLRGFGISNVRLSVKSDESVHAPEAVHDPYLLSDDDAVRALEAIKRHGELFFHDIPHHQSLLENQQLRLDNRLEPNRLGSIRHSWIYFRP